MRLIKARVQNYRSVEDSEWVDIDDVTCLVGKNEAGKTAFLQAIHRLNPTSGSQQFDETMDYPSRHFAKYKKVRAAKPAEVVSCTFELEEHELTAVAELFGEGFLTASEVTVTKGYGPGRRWLTKRDDQKLIEHLVGQIDAPKLVKDKLLKATTADDLAHAIGELDEPRESATAVKATIEGWRSERPELAMIDAVLEPALPRFFYFDDYSVMPGRAAIPDLIARRESDTLEPSDETLLRLLQMVGAAPEDFQDESRFERLTRELEAAANGISEEVFEYWRQNPGLEVSAVMSNPEADAHPPLDQGPILNIRIRNPRHKVTVPFDERSKGFVWFFSFFAYFSDLENDEDADVILLLDEPGLSLHATAQADFLDFIDGRLSDRHQVIYTTHSPFMIQANRLDRVRTVEDVDDRGTVVSSDVLRTDAATTFPLQAALGYDLAQTLFLGPDCLLVEGPSDLLYLQLLGDALQAAGKDSIEARWVVTPTGGASNLVTFVSLIGANQLNVAVLMDASRADTQKIRNLLSTGKISAPSIIQISEFVGNDDADIEDLFEVGFYLELVSGAYADELGGPIKVGDLKSGHPRVVLRVAQHFKDNGIAGGHFNHYRPASYFLREQSKLLAKLNAATLDRAEALAKRINARLS